MARGSDAKAWVVKTMKEAFGDAFLGEYNSKYYIKARENGTDLQIAVALTCPKTNVESFSKMDFGNNELNFEDEDGVPIQAMNKPTEISKEEQENLQKLLDKLGL